jgi:glycosyltransferase involved in cell wall biosynthesis
MTSILVHARGAVGRTMGSTGVRCYHMARVLAQQLPEAQVTLSIPNDPGTTSPHPRLRVVQHHNARDTFLQMLRHDIIISRNFPPHMMALFPQKRLVLDFYSVLFVEWLAFGMRIPSIGRRKLWSTANRHYVDYQLTLADYLFCSNERQRDLWIGALSALGLVTPPMYDHDSTLRRLVDVIPYGIQPGRPRHAKRVLKGVVPGIRETDKLLIWNGSIMEWFDAETVVRAMAKVARVRDDVKLFFLGTEHPDWVTGMLFDPPRAALHLSEELGLLDSSVYFNFGWVPYQEIGNYLAEADIGVCAGLDNLEARYAFRTRYVDLFWAELPVICTRGDVLAERIQQGPLGIVVPPGDVDAYADAILRLVDDQDFYQSCQAGMPAIKEELSWESVLRPLVEFCRNPESIAAPKRQRLLPLLRRSVWYLATYARQRAGRD